MRKFRIRSLVLIALFVLTILLMGLFIYTQKFKKNIKVHYHAGFQVYVDGKLQDFSDLKYMFIKPCGKEKSDKKENEQLEKAHLHDQVGDVVHVEAQGAKWGDLFGNINFKIDNNKQLKSYIKGKEVRNILDFPIKPYDSIVIFIGNVENKDEKLKKQVTRKRIEEVEKKSETCGDE